MRTSPVMLACAAAGVIGGAFLVGLWCVGLAVIAESITLGVYAVLRDSEGRAEAPAGIASVTTLDEVLHRARAAP